MGRVFFRIDYKIGLRYKHPHADVESAITDSIFVGVHLFVGLWRAKQLRNAG
jgi:hypothetical protein